MAHRTSRRDLICEAALDLAAEGGNHALTHQGIDARLGLARGSTSYYYRTRHALVSAVIEHLTRRSREYFRDAVPAHPPATAEQAATAIADQLETLLTERRRDTAARYALMTDAAADDELRDGLASCLFSLPSATELMDTLGARSPSSAARDLVALLEGLAFTHTAAATDRSAPLRATVQLWITALIGEP